MPGSKLSKLIKERICTLLVKAGGHQEKVEVGDVILVNRLDAKKGDTVEFPVALVVDGDKVTRQRQGSRQHQCQG